MKIDTALFTTLAAPAVGHVMSYEIGCASLDTYVQQSWGIFAPVYPHIRRDLETVKASADRIVSLSPEFFLRELSDENSATMRAGKILGDLDDALPRSLIATSTACHFLSTCVTHGTTTLEQCFGDPHKQELVKGVYQITQESALAELCEIFPAIVFILNTSDRETPEHAQALAFGLGLYIAQYFSALFRAVHLNSFVVMQEQDPARLPTMPLLKEAVDFAVAHEIPRWNTGDADLERLLEEALRRVPMLLTMLETFTTHWGNIPIDAYQSIAALAYTLGCTSAGKRSFDIFLARADGAARPKNGCLFAELMEVVPWHV